MTLDEIIAYTTGQLGIDDDTARTRAAASALFRWKMVWNKFMWRQSRHADTVAVAEGVQEFTLPVLFDLVHAIRIDGQAMLEPTLDLDAVWNDPAGRDTPGATFSFSVLGKDETGAVRVRLHRPPQKAAALLVLGKRTPPPLIAGTDTPMGVPGIDEALCAYVLGDLHRWIRQFTKANDYYAEANALLAESIKIETQQNAETRCIIPSVQMLEEDPGAPEWLP